MQFGSMVAIERLPDVEGSTRSSRFPEEDKYRLVYSKSKVYVNPTAYARDNMPGFASLVKRVCVASHATTRTDRTQEAVNPIYLLAWIPETLLHERGATEWDKFVKIEEKATLDEEDEGMRRHNSQSLTLHDVFISRCCSDRSSNTTA